MYPSAVYPHINLEASVLTRSAFDKARLVADRASLALNTNKLYNGAASDDMLSVLTVQRAAQRHWVLTNSPYSAPQPIPRRVL